MHIAIYSFSLNQKEAGKEERRTLETHVKLWPWMLFHFSWAEVIHLSETLQWPVAWCLWSDNLISTGLHIPNSSHPNSRRWPTYSSISASSPPFPRVPYSSSSLCEPGCSVTVSMWPTVYCPRCAAKQGYCWNLLSGWSRRKKNHLHICDLNYVKHSVMRD